MKTALVLFTAIASIHCVLSAHRDHQSASHGIRRLRRGLPGGTAGPLLASVMPERSRLLFIGIPSASQVIPMATHLSSRHLG